MSGLMFILGIYVGCVLTVFLILAISLVADGRSDRLARRRASYRLHHSRNSHVTWIGSHDRKN
jgi:hypothetical protein